MVTAIIESSVRNGSGFLKGGGFPKGANDKWRLRFRQATVGRNVPSGHDVDPRRQRGRILSAVAAGISGFHGFLRRRRDGAHRPGGAALRFEGAVSVAKTVCAGRSDPAVGAALSPSSF